QGLGRHALEFVQKPDRGGPPADHQDTQPGEVLGRTVLGRGYLDAAKIRTARDVGAEGSPPCSGGVDHHGGTDRAAVGVDDEVVITFVDLADLHRTPHLEPEMFFVTLVVLPYDVPGRSGRLGAREAESEFFHPGQVVDLVDL